MNHTIRGNMVDLHQRRIYGAEINIENGFIQSITESGESYSTFIMPGFVDSHIHIESSMCTPAVFGEAAIQHGTIATISDPHEIANVLGIKGIETMIESAKESPVKIFFGAPSCVPATPFESAGATINAEDIETLMGRDDIWFLCEMMNYPGVLNGDAEVMAKIAASKKYGKPVDGHAPGLGGDLAVQYANAGISTDHETYSLNNAIDKINAGMSIQIREGSAAKNFEDLIPLLHEYPEKVMFCSDDLHPDNLMNGHINLLVKRAIDMGYDFFDVLRAACINPIEHYKVPVGMLRVGDPADFIVVKNVNDFPVESCYINGIEVFPSKKKKEKNTNTENLNRFDAEKITVEDIAIADKGAKEIHVIKAEDGSLLTMKMKAVPKIMDGKIVADIENDILKVVVLNRYEKAKPAVSFINGFCLKEGAFATSVAHDSHNIIAIGTNDDDITLAINSLIDSKGGICVTNDGKLMHHLILPLAGLMSDEDPTIIAEKFRDNNEEVKKMGSTFENPFITASFMALLVIPAIKLSDKGLFDSEQFSFLSISLLEDYKQRI